ncbi:pap 25a associated domain family [Lichtheimia corymbifera JMRC:FSU:9682]|uniref:polynucleotide adenylyltransferase n=1 Tax=Lichtheimia corymbifera JMRC:FSU:9682 TaxID=1263082 RepID=A0A068RQQ6_9FUNG|nr:pap 25a associated domain family [Lichtheimia corymbifera JMRC:FSU:9682]
MLSTQLKSLCIEEPHVMPFLSLDDPFKSPHACAPVREYGASDVTSDESTDLSSPAEPSSPQAPDVDDHADISPSVPIILPDRHIEDALSVDILELHESLLPTMDSYVRRTKFVNKIETILNEEWPGHDIRAYLFGSSENDLGTSTSDVDICLKTTWPNLELSTLAAALRKHGMERVWMVPHAKVPIVKMWDPVLQLACDMNINNTLALQNTKMVKTYCAIDPRVRPLAMAIKHWTRQRALNDAAYGGTLSTYTWTCMIINFLQMREPPILPVLHQMDHEKSPDNVVIHGHDSSFFTNVDALQGFGRRNQESLAGLLFAFFRRFAYEFDYDTQVVSVRHGRYLSKVEKEWDQGQNSRLLCVEEPFNVFRNLGNSADEASVVGIKIEFQRAVHILLESYSLDMLCQPVLPPSQQQQQPSSSTHHRHPHHHLRTQQQQQQHYAIQAVPPSQHPSNVSSLTTTTNNNNSMASYPYYMYYPTPSTSHPPSALVGQDPRQYCYSPTTRYQPHHSNVYTPFPSNNNNIPRSKHSNNSTTAAPSSYVNRSFYHPNYQRQANKGSGKRHRSPINQPSNGNGRFQQQQQQQQGYGHQQYIPTIQQQQQQQQQQVSYPRGIQRNASRSPPPYQTSHWISPPPSIPGRNGYNSNATGQQRQQQNTKGRRWNGPKKPKGKRIQQHHPPTTRQIFA